MSLYDEELKHGIVAPQAYTELREERDTLITALRECVVALENSMIHQHTEYGPNEWCGICEDTQHAISKAKSTLERYKHEHP